MNPVSKVLKLPLLIEAVESIRNILEARAGIEPAYTDLQSAASPLCHLARLFRRTRRTTLNLAEKMERETGFEPATPTLARLCSTTELFPP